MEGTGGTWVIERIGVLTIRLEERWRNPDTVYRSVRTGTLDRMTAVTTHRSPAADATIPAPRTDAQLLAAYAETRDPLLREALVERFLPLARSIAKRYRKAEEPFDDLLQVASLGLLKAVDRFDPARGIAFSSFAVPTIVGELRRHFRDRCWSVRPPRELQERALEVDKYRTELTTRLGRSPSRARDRPGAGARRRAGARGAAGPAGHARRVAGRAAGQRRGPGRDAGRRARRRSTPS